MNINILVGETLADIVVSADKTEIRVLTTTGRTYLMFHAQDCCENVQVEDIAGDLQDLIGVPLLVAEERTQVPADTGTDSSSTWTFYRLGTIKGSVVIRWLGESNGYYSESVEFIETATKKPAHD